MACLIQDAFVTPLETDSVRISHDRFRLDNGLTVIIHENRRAPTVSIEMLYRVGAKEEPAGKTGFAHLFEHLMFCGSANLPGLFINNLLAAGASNLNGTTSFDRTNYYQTVPACALDYALFAESDRMGHFYETINTEMLELQREVVLNEKQQREGQPYGLVGERITRGTYPAGHPYAHTVMGSIEDISAATLDDVRNWFKTYYGPSNAVLCMAGDIDLQTARQKVTRFFGHIPPGPPLGRQIAWVPKMSGTRREILEDRVPQTSLFMVWNVPQYGERDTVLLGLAARLLCDGMSSRLNQRLVLDEKLASRVVASAAASTLCGQFSVSVLVRDGMNLSAVEQAVREEIERLGHAPVLESELERAQQCEFVEFVRSLERTSAIAHMLAIGEARMGTPDSYEQDLAWVRSATPEAVRQAVERWLSDGVYILTVRPFPALKSVSTGIDRSQIPAIGEPARVTLPPLQRCTLSNGLSVVLAEQSQLPLVHFRMMFESGSVLEPSGARGIGRLLATMMGKGCGERDALAFSEATQRFGADIGVAIGPEWSSIVLSSLKAQLDSSVGLYADFILRPRFDGTELERERGLAIEEIEHEIASAGSLMSRALPAFVFPAGHPYARPLSGTGLKSELVRLCTDDLAVLHGQWFCPSRATLLVVGDTTLARIKPLLEKHFASWRQTGVAGPSTVAVASARPVVAVPARPAAAVHLLHKPGALQTIVSAATLLPPMQDALERLRLSFLNTTLCGGFSSRINLNLREDKHWTYGVASNIVRYRRSQLFYVSAPVQSDKTAESIAEIRRELAAVGGPNPVTAEELARAKRQSSLSLGASFSTLTDLSGAIEFLVQQGLPDDYYATHQERTDAVTLDSVNRLARELIDADEMVWTVIGDLREIEHPIRDLSLGPVLLHDANDEGPYGR